MNDDDFEKKLRALTGALQRPNPTVAWKADILARARREANAVPIQPMPQPRWLVLSWAASWAAILALNFATPRNAPSPAADGIASRVPSATADLTASPQTVLAFEQRMNRNADLP